MQLCLFVWLLSVHAGNCLAVRDIFLLNAVVMQCDALHPEHVSITFQERVPKHLRGEEGAR